MRLMSPVPVKNQASSAVGPARARRGVPPGPASRRSVPPSAVGALDVAVARRRFLHNQLIDSVLGHGPLQAAVRARSFLEALGLLDLQAAVLSLSPTEAPT